jgi:GGDEF domain-containing protein
LRVRNSLRRRQQGSLTNTVTGLPEGNLVDERLLECLQTKNWAILLARLENLDRFREVYGFVASDDLLRAVAIMLKDTLREVGNPNDFLGHISPTEFIMVVDQENLLSLKDRIYKKLAVTLEYFYHDQDRESGVFRDKKLAVKTAEVPGWQPYYKDLEQLKTIIFLAIRGE